MPQVAYVDGQYLPLADAHVPVEDRGLQFADSLYEVAAIFGGKLLDWPAHLARLRRNCAVLFITLPQSDAALTLVAQRLIGQSRYQDAIIYIQVTRGTAKRDHVFAPGLKPRLIMTVRRFDFRQRVAQQATGVGVITVPDQRWGRVDIKSTGLLANVLAKQDARATGSFEAWFTSDNDVVREGGSTSAYIVKDGTLITHPLSAHILPGIARQTLLRLARAAQIPVAERTFSRSEALAADEAVLTSTTAPILPVTRIDGQAVGDGKPGPVTRRLIELVAGEIERQTGWR